MAQQEEVKLPEGWEVLNFSKELTQIATTNKKIAAKSYLPSGIYPVIDQGQEFIVGYCDDVDRLITIEKPVVVFGDHTRAIKFVDFDFVPGADGTKVLIANDYFDPKYFYYMLRVIELPDKGYSRHFKYLKEANSLVAPLPEQKRIVKKLDSLLAQVDTIQQRLNNLPGIIKRFRQSVLAAAVSGKLTEQWRGESNIANPEKSCLNSLGRVYGGKTPSKSNSRFWEEGSIPWVSPKDMKVYEISSSQDFITDLALTDGGMNLVPKGSILMVTRSGILAHTFPVAITMCNLTINQDIKGVLGIFPSKVT